jgi:small subunit ribosomal protein S3
MGQLFVDIERNPQEIVINIHTAKPGLIIGRSGQGVNELKDYLEKQLNLIKLPYYAGNIANKKKLLARKIKVNIIKNL